MKLGTEDKKKTALAIGLSVVALGTLYVNVFSGGGSTSSTPRPRPAATQPSAEAPLQPQARPSRTVAAVQAARSTSRTNRRRQTNNFEPIWQQSHEGEFDPLAADPTLRTDLLAAVRTVPMSNYSRNIFQFGERRRIEQPLTEAEKQKAAALATAQKPPTPAPTPKPAAAAPPPARKAPRITWKYYGFASPTGDGKRRAFLLDGEDVLIGGEGAVFRERYKVKRIGMTSIVMEDLEYSEEQTLPITAPTS
jgi:hypothetical protein